VPNDLPAGAYTIEAGTTTVESVPAPCTIRVVRE
jgi:hypothetical protein